MDYMKYIFNVFRNLLKQNLNGLKQLVWALKEWNFSINNIIILLSFNALGIIFISRVFFICINSIYTKELSANILHEILFWTFLLTFFSIPYTYILYKNLGSFTIPLLYNYWKDIIGDVCEIFLINLKLFYSFLLISALSTFWIPVWIFQEILHLTLETKIIKDYFIILDFNHWSNPEYHIPQRSIIKDNKELHETLESQNSLKNSKWNLIGYTLGIIVVIIITIIVSKN